MTRTTITHAPLGCLLAAGLLLLPVLAHAAILPERTPPAGFASVNGAAGGRTVAGTITGNARSASAVLGGMLKAGRGQQDASNRGYYIRGIEMLEASPSGRRGNFDRDFADAVVTADPTKYRLVPPSQYRISD